MKRFLVLVLMVAAGLGLVAQKQNVRDYVSIRFVPSHGDWVYRCGEAVEIEVAAVRHYVPIGGAELRYQWGPELRPAELEKRVRTGSDGVLKLSLPGAKEPGFKTLTVSVTVEGREYKNYINLGFEPDQIRPTTEMPKDFKAFWDQSIAAARKVPLLSRLTPRPDLSDGNCDAYEVRFQNFAPGQYLYGTLCVPKGVRPDDAGARKCPAVIIWPGAGVKPHPGIKDYFPERGVITLEMGINGIPVNLSQELYDDLRYNALKDYNLIRQDDREEYYYRKVYAGTVKTVDFLCSLPCVDESRIGAFGGSQGGALTLVNAALDPRIKAAAVSYPALAEIAGFAKGRVSGWPKLKHEMPVYAYYDVVNFARMIRCPVWFMLGYNDQTCCPTSTYAVYNSLGCEKVLLTPLDCAHWMYGEHRRMRDEWVKGRIED